MRVQASSIGTRVSAISCLEVSSRHTNRAVGIAGPHVDGEHIFHRCYKGTVGLRRDDPALPAMRLETVFLSVRPIVESLARSTMPSSTTLFSNSRSVQRPRPLGGQSDQLGFLFAVENALHCWRLALLEAQNRLEAFFH